MSVGIIGGNVRLVGTAVVSVNVGSVAANTTAEQDFTVPGCKAGDFVFVNKPSLSAGLGIVNARVKADGTVSITFVNATAAPIDPAAENYLFLFARPVSSPGAVSF